MAGEQASRITAASRERKAYRLGFKKRRPVARVRQHVQLLRRTMSIRGIAKAAGVTHQTILKIMRGEVETVLPATERKILAVTPTVGAVLLDSIGAQRRVQALAAAGWTGEEIGRLVAARRGDAWANINRVLNGRRITASLAHEIAAVYEDLQQQVPPSTTASKRAKARAQRNRWAPPAAWDGIDIDDPDAKPDWSAVRCESECGRPVRPGWTRCMPCLDRLEKHGTLDNYSPLRNGRALAEDAVWISEQEGWSLREEAGAALVAERLGVTLTALQRSLTRHGDTITQAEALAEEGAQQ